MGDNKASQIEAYIRDISEPHASCSAEALFPNINSLMFRDPKYTVCDPGGMYVTQVWAIAEDPNKVPGCVMCLVKFLDGSPVAVRYHKSRVFKKVLVPLF